MKIWLSTALQNETERLGELDPLIPGMLRGPAAWRGLELLILSKLLLSWCQES